MSRASQDVPGPRGHIFKNVGKRNGKFILELNRRCPGRPGIPGDPRPINQECSITGTCLIVFVVFAYLLVWHLIVLFDLIVAI